MLSRYTTLIMYTLFLQRQEPPLRRSINFLLSGCCACPHHRSLSCALIPSLKETLGRKALLQILLGLFYPQSFFTTQSRFFFFFFTVVQPRYQLFLSYMSQYNKINLIPASPLKNVSKMEMKSSTSLFPPNHHSVMADEVNTFPAVY